MNLAQFRSPSLIVAGAFAAVCALVFGAVVLWPRSDQIVPPVEANAPAALAATTPSIAGSAIDEASVLERPIFEPSRKRRPPPPAAEEQARPVAERAPLSRLDGYRVVGLVLAANAAIALVERPGGGEALRIGRGDVVEGWMAASVSDRGIDFVQQGEHLTLSIPRHDDGQRHSASAGGVP